MIERKTIRRIFVAILAAAATAPVWAQSRALPSGDVEAIYQRLLERIKTIRIFDHHAHPGFGDDSDVDAQATPPQHLPFRERDTNPELVTAVKALFDYPYSDMSTEHMHWLQERSTYETLDSYADNRKWQCSPGHLSQESAPLPHGMCSHHGMACPETSSILFRLKQESGRSQQTGPFRLDLI